MAQTVITNVSGADQYFGYIPPHGATIEDEASVTLDGDLRTILASGRGRYGRKTEIASLDSDEADGVVTVVVHPTLESSEG